MATRPKKPRTTDSAGPQAVDQQEDHILQPSSSKSDKTKSDGSSSFLKAARAGNLDKILELLQSGKADVNTCNSNGLNALHLAAKEGHIDIVTELLGRGADVNTATKKGNTALHIASLAGQLDVVKILVQNGGKINSQSQNGFTPLYMASQECHVPVVRYLLDKGANATLATEDGFTPMAVALQQGHNDIVNALMEHTQKGRVRLSALHVAAKKDDLRAAALLLQNDQNAGQSGGIVNEITKSDFTPLHIASHYGNLNVAALLIEKGANVNFKAKNGITPLHVSSKWGRKNIVQLLLENNANIECQTRDGLTALHCAARSGHDMVVGSLLEHGASVSSKTRNGLTALHMSAQGDHVECARILIAYKAPIDEVTVDYLTPLHVAAHCGNVALAKLLLDNQCQVDSRALNGFTPLHIACKKNRVRVIELLLQYGALLNSTTESGLTPLHVASFMGHMEVVTYLLQRGSDPNSTTVRGETSLHLATRGNQIAIMKVLLRNGALVDAKAKEQQTALHIAARLGATDCVLVLLEHGASINATTVELYTPLHIAAKEGHDEIIQILLDRGADRQRTTSKGFTALHIAAKYGSLRVANILLKKNANPNVDGKNGLTPLHVAAHYNHPAMVKLLLDQRANPHCVAKNGYTALHIAAKKDELDVAAILLDSGAKANAESKNGFTPFHLASQEGHCDMVALLLENKAHVNGRAKNGLTAMHLAAQEDHVPVAEVLVKYNAAIDPPTKAGYTPLHTACHFGQLNMIRFLLDHGASVSSVTKQGYTPLHQAAQQGHVLVINILLRYKADPNALTTTGLTPLSIAQQLGYISVIEILKQVTQVVVSTSATVQYKMLSPEVMQEAAMSDEEEEADEVRTTDQSYQYLTTETMHAFEDDALATVRSKERDLFAFEHLSDRRSIGSSVGGRDKIQDELRYTTGEADELVIESPTTMGTLEYSTVPAGKRNKPKSPPASPGYNTDDMDVDKSIDDGVSAWDDHVKHFESNVQVTEKLTVEETVHVINSQDMKLKMKPLALDVNAPQVNGVNIIITGDNTGEQQRQERAYFVSSTPLTETLPTPTETRAYHSNMSESDSRMYGSSSAMSYASSFDPDNVTMRRPVFSGFLVSFLVDARGGAMRGCRHSGIRIIIPPLKVCQPTRITCKLVRRDKLIHPPPLMEGEALASRVLLMGPAGAKFTGPVVLEIPHFAALGKNEREIIVLRSENGQAWREHADIATEQSMQHALCGSFEDLESAEDLYQRRITRIITSDFPKYFAIVTRIRQDSSILGPEGGAMNSLTVPQVQVVFPPGALTKSIKVGLQVQSLPSEMVAKILGPDVFVGPITTIEPRRRKFHRAITVTLPLPREMQSELKTGATTNTSHLRLLCSISGGTDATEWEDITGSTPMSLTNTSVSFTTSVSARFWLLYTQRHSSSVLMATQLYSEAIVVPFMANFVVFAKRRTKTEAQLRLFCMTDDKMDKTLECQENFHEIARSRDVEVLNGKPQYIEMEGNLIIVHKQQADDADHDKQLYINFRAFRENRRHINVRSWDPTQPAVGTAIFLSDPPVRLNQIPICNLIVNLDEAAEGNYDEITNLAADTADLCLKLEALRKLEFPDDDRISKAQLRLTDIAEYLEGDWIVLARHLNITSDEITKIQLEYGYVVEQALVMLHLWVEKNKENATGNMLERALTCIHREDIIIKCIQNVEQVTDVSEQRVAKAQLTSTDTPSDALQPPSASVAPVKRTDERIKVSTTQVRTSHKTIQVSATRVQTSDEKSHEATSMQVKTSDEKSHEATSMQVKTSDEKSHEASSMEVKTTHKTIQVSATRVQTSDEKSHEATSMQVKTSDEKSHEASSMEVKTTHKTIQVSATRVQTSDEKSHEATSMQVKTSDEKSHEATCMQMKTSDEKSHETSSMQVKTTHETIQVSATRVKTSDEKIHDATSMQVRTSDETIQVSVTPVKVKDDGDDCIVAELDSRRPVKYENAVDSVTYSAAVDVLAGELSFDPSEVADDMCARDEVAASRDHHINLATPPSTPTISTDLCLSPRVTEEELVASISRKSTSEKEWNYESLEFESQASSDTKPLVQTFEDWATQSAPPSSEKEMQPSQPTSVKQAYLETAFEDWVEQQEMSHAESAATNEQLSSELQPGDENGYEEGAEISRELIEGDIEIRLEMDDSEQTREDGSKVYRQVLTRRHVRPVSEYLIVNGVPTHCQTTDRLVSIQIEEDLLVLPPGVESPDESDNLKTVTDIRETENKLSDGTPVTHKVVTTVIVPKLSASEPLQSVGVLLTTPEIEKQAEQIVSQSVQAALEEVQTLSYRYEDGDQLADEVPDKDYDDSDMATLRVYTDTLEGEPQVETEVQEFEDTLPDGTIIRRRITKTKQKQTIIKRVVMEGPEDELPTTEEQAQQFLIQNDLDHSIDKDILQRYGDRSVTESVDEPETRVQEFEETLDDGTIVRRKIVTTTQQQLTTERVVLEGESDEDFDTSYNGSERVFNALVSDDDARQNAESAEDSKELAANDEDSDDDGASTRIVLKKEIRTQRVLRDGKEETVITEDIHVVQEDEPPAEIEGAVQNVIDQFIGRSHSGQSSV